MNAQTLLNKESWGVEDCQEVIKFIWQPNETPVYRPLLRFIREQGYRYERATRRSVISVMVKTIHLRKEDGLMRFNVNFKDPEIREALQEALVLTRELTGLVVIKATEKFARLGRGQLNWLLLAPGGSERFEVTVSPDKKGFRCTPEFALVFRLLLSIHGKAQTNLTSWVEKNDEELASKDYATRVKESLGWSDSQFAKGMDHVVDKSKLDRDKYLGKIKELVGNGNLFTVRRELIECYLMASMYADEIMRLRQTISTSHIHLPVEFNDLLNSRATGKIVAHMKAQASHLKVEINDAREAAGDDDEKFVRRMNDLLDQREEGAELALELEDGDKYRFTALDRLTLLVDGYEKLAVAIGHLETAKLDLKNLHLDFPQKAIPPIADAEIPGIPPPAEPDEISKYWAKTTRVIAVVLNETNRELSGLPPLTYEKIGGILNHDAILAPILPVSYGEDEPLPGWTGEYGGLGPHPQHGNARDKTRTFQEELKAGTNLVSTSTRESLDDMFNELLSDARRENPELKNTLPKDAQSLRDKVLELESTDPHWKNKLVEVAESRFKEFRGTVSPHAQRIRDALDKAQQTLKILNDLPPLEKKEEGSGSSLVGAGPQDAIDAMRNHAAMGFLGAAMVLIYVGADAWPMLIMSFRTAVQAMFAYQLYMESKDDPTRVNNVARIVKFQIGQLNALPLAFLHASTKASQRRKMEERERQKKLDKELREARKKAKDDEKEAKKEREYEKQCTKLQWDAARFTQAEIERLKTAEQAKQDNEQKEATDYAGAMAVFQRVANNEGGKDNNYDQHSYLSLTDKDHPASQLAVTYPGWDKKSDSENTTEEQDKYFRGEIDFSPVKQGMAAAAAAGEIATKVATTAASAFTSTGRYLGYICMGIQLIYILSDIFSMTRAYQGLGAINAVLTDPSNSGSMKYLETIIQWFGGAKGTTTEDVLERTFKQLKTQGAPANIQDRMSNGIFPPEVFNVRTVAGNYLLFLGAIFPQWAPKGYIAPFSDIAKDFVFADLGNAALSLTAFLAMPRLFIGMTVAHLADSTLTWFGFPELLTNILTSGFGAWSGILLLATLPIMIDGFQRIILGRIPLIGGLTATNLDVAIERLRTQTKAKTKTQIAWQAYGFIINSISRIVWYGGSLLNPFSRHTMLRRFLGPLGEMGVINMRGLRKRQGGDFWGILGEGLLYVLMIIGGATLNIVAEASMAMLWATVIGSPVLMSFAPTALFSAGGSVTLGAAYMGSNDLFLISSMLGLSIEILTVKSLTLIPAAVMATFRIAKIIHNLYTKAYFVVAAVNDYAFSEMKPLSGVTNKPRITSQIVAGVVNKRNAFFSCGHQVTQELLRLKALGTAHRCVVRVSKQVSTGGKLVVTDIGVVQAPLLTDKWLEPLENNPFAAKANDQDPELKKALYSVIPMAFLYPFPPITDTTQGMNLGDTYLRFIPNRALLNSSVDAAVRANDVNERKTAGHFDTLVLAQRFSKTSYNDLTLSVLLRAFAMPDGEFGIEIFKLWPQTTP